MRAFLRRRGRVWWGHWSEGKPRKLMGRSSKIKTRSAPTEWLNELNKELEARETGAGMSWLMYCKLYKEYSLGNKVLESYKRDVITINLFNDLIAIPTLQDLSPSQLDKYKTFRKNAGKKETTINRELGTLKSMSARAKFLKLIHEDPWLPVPKYQTPPSKPETFVGQEKQILTGCVDPYDLVLVGLGLYQGLRRSEMANLKWENIDFEEDVIRVISTHGRRTKTKKERFLPLHKRVKEDLLALRKEGADKVYVLGRNEVQSGRDYLSDRFTKILRWAGITDGHLHLTRHTHGTNVLKNNDIETARVLLGHDRVTTTQIYTHTNEELKRKAIDSLK